MTGKVVPSLAQGRIFGETHGFPGENLAGIGPGPLTVFGHQHIETAEAPGHIFRIVTETGKGLAVDEHEGAFGIHFIDGFRQKTPPVRETGFRFPAGHLPPAPAGRFPPADAGWPVSSSRVRSATRLSRISRFSLSNRRRSVTSVSTKMLVPESFLPGSLRIANWRPLTFKGVRRPTAKPLLMSEHSILRMRERSLRSTTSMRLAPMISSRGLPRNSRAASLA